MIALAIVLTGVGSYAMRAFFIFALARYAFPPLLLGVEFAAPVLFVSLMMAASDRRDKLAAAAIAMGVTYLLASLPNRAGILIAVIVSVCIMLFATRRQST